MRLILFLIIVTLLSVGAAWFASTNGHVSIDWLGYRYESSFPVFVIILLVVLFIINHIFRLLASALKVLTSKNK